MGDVISSHLDEGKREIITARTTEVMSQFGALYDQQYGVALFNKVRFDVEGGGGPQPQLLHRKVPLENRCIFSGSLFQYLEENKKWRNRFLFIPDSYSINYYDSKTSHDRGLQPKGTISCAGYKVLTSMEQYLELVANSLPGVKAKVGSSPFLKVATQFPLILWHPYGRHLYFCVVTEKEQQKWLAVFQDCVRHANDGLSEEDRVQTPAFTDTVRLYRQAKGQYGTWDMMCGGPPQILSNLVMEVLVPELRDLIAPRLKGKLQDRQRNWMLISDAVYDLVQRQCKSEFRDVEQRSEAGRPLLEASIRTDMDQIITSKEHVTNKIRGAVLSKADKLLKVSIQPYISSILEALMEPTSRGFSEVRDVFFRELVEMSKNALNQGTKETVAEHMEKISMLAFHPVKMQPCYEKVEQLSLDGLQQRFDVSSPSVFVQRAQILMREQMDDAVYTFEQILHQSLESQGTESLCKTIQGCQDRVIKKFDYDSSTVRKRFFREALLQIFIPYMLKQLTPSCSADLPGFQELIFADFSRFILVENIFEEVVLQSVMKDIMTTVKDAAVQRRHNLYRDSIVLTNSDPNLHLLGEQPAVDWAEQYGAPGQDEGVETETDGLTEAQKKRRRMKQVVSMIQVEGTPGLVNESCLDVPGVDLIPEEKEKEEECQEEETEEEKGVDKKKDADAGVPAEKQPPNGVCNGTAVPDSTPDVPANASPAEEAVVKEAAPEEAPPSVVGEQPSAASPQGEAAPPQSEAAPPQSDATPPQNDGTPLQIEATPLQSEATPPQSDATPLQSDVVPPQSDVAPPQSDVAPPQSAATPLQSEATPPQSDVVPPQSAATPLQSEATPPQCEATPPQSEPAAVGKEEQAEDAPTAQEPADGAVATATPEAEPVAQAPQQSAEQPAPASSPEPTPPESTPLVTDQETATADLPPPPSPPTDGEGMEEVAPPPEGPDAPVSSSSSSSPPPSSSSPPPLLTGEEVESPRQQPETEPTRPSDTRSAEEAASGAGGQ